MKNINNYDFHPRDVADKSSKENLKKAIRLALDTESDALRENTQSFNSNRYKAVATLHDYDELKKHAREIKEYSIENLPELIKQVTLTIESRGGKVFFAKTKDEANDYIKKICLSQNAERVVKAKSITSEEICLNCVLEKAGIEVAETDLAEFILQVSKEQPSHIVAPAIHRSRERISELFKKHFNTALPLETGEELTKFARDILRKKFLSADIGISGANLIAAKEGAVLLVESEGNIRLTTHLPSVHICLAGIEKIIPSKKDFGTFIELLAASGTGQLLTSYTNILEPPLKTPVMNFNGRHEKQREFHLVLLDNGRMAMREDHELKEALYCIRCSACMNVCANFQTVGGHAFGGECYNGGIGGAWTFKTSGDLGKARFAELCSGCSRCIPNCPVKINIPGLNTVIKNRIIKEEGYSFQKWFFGNFSNIAKVASLLPGISNWISKFSFSRKLYESIIGFDKRRPIPKFAGQVLSKSFDKYKENTTASQQKKQLGRNVFLFGDVYTNYNNPQVGIAVIKVFEKLGIKINMTKVIEDGRAAQSQGLLKSASESAIKTSMYLESLIDEGSDILFAEPSVLAMIRMDYKSLINKDELFGKLKQHCFDPIEYLNKLINENKITIDELSKLISNRKDKLFYHGHCQMKSIGIGNVTVEFFEKFGFTVDTSSVECCGMAGSFGYKKQYYEISKSIGHELGKQIAGSKNKTVVLASGTSCREQIMDELECIVYHPIEFLNMIMS